MDTSIPFGHRQFGKYRRKIESKEELVQQILEHNGVHPCYLSVSIFEDNAPYLTSLPFDFDSTDLDKAKKDALKLYNIFLAFNWSASLVFSGRKGFHIHLYTQIQYYPDVIIQNVHNFYRCSLDLETLDIKVLGQANRLMRIPGTVHEKNGQYCFTIDKNHGKKVDLFDINGIDINPELLEELSSESISKRDNLHPYPCVEEHIKDTGKNHMVRFGWVVYRKLKGLPKRFVYKEICKIGRKYWDDFSSQLTKKQIEQIYRTPYEMPSCQTYKDLGKCIDECPLDEWFSQ